MEFAHSLLHRVTPLLMESYRRYGGRPLPKRRLIKHASRPSPKRQQYYEYSIERRAETCGADRSREYPTAIGA
jgi:hypothetical protein